MSSSQRMPEVAAGERERLRQALLTDDDGLLTSTRQRLARLAHARGAPAHAVDDIVQEALLEAWSHLGRLTAPAGFAAWADEICRNVCRRAADREARASQRTISSTSHQTRMAGDSDEVTLDLLTTVPDEQIPDPLDAFDQHDRETLLDKALGLMNPAAREVVSLCDLGELPHREAAARLGVTSGALDVRLYRARQELKAILSGPLRNESEALGLTIDASIAEGWRGTRMWCSRCGTTRLEGQFFQHDGYVNSTTLHVHCPRCFQECGEDSVHSMGLVPLNDLRSLRPAWKRTMTEMAALVVSKLTSESPACVFCGKPARLVVRHTGDDGGLTRERAYPFWLEMRCLHCGDVTDASGGIPTIDQLVAWSHPQARDFLLSHPRVRSVPSSLLHFQGAPAIRVELASVTSTERMTITAHRDTLHILAIEG